MKKVVFIINPRSGNGYGEEIGKKIEELIPSLPYESEILYTKRKNDAKEFASRYFKSDDVVILAVGGDGTMNEVLNGIHAGVTMGIIPSGSGNDFFRMIDPKISDIKELVKATINGRVEYVDYGIVNGSKFLDSFSIGLDAAIAYKAKDIQMKNPKVRKSAYLRAILSEIFHNGIFNVHYEDSSIHVNQSCLLISALNGKYYGGGFKPTPDANYQDGMLDINIIEGMTTSRMISLVPIYMKGKHYGCKEVISTLSNRFTLTCDKEVAAQIDGELFMGSIFDVQVVQQGLPILIAKGKE